MKKLVMATAMVVAAFSQAHAAKPCEELKTEIAAKLDAKGVTGYTLEIVENDKVGEAKVVGSCEAGTKKITYRRE
ncbi:MAG TPA: DUF1161 domain-containing protein [Povalibacter sp.]|nr:DUF1161 domain-containing protein [Povalibacter sp.]